ncbi:alpha-mannosidase [Paenibacillus sp. BK720]|uniref:alpha-mannosidase n=1 Tax=Paenibacillus sp. BK720 TaxID=2587092 RepID=UPI001420D704|nr:alpha-mannosidase [Paenibacillus sp. BK720]NIK67288.1 alpha-mannosidase [Paenibacillus sp. BK720]
MFLTERKLEKRIQEVESWRYTDKRQIPIYQFWIDKTAEIGVLPPDNAEWRTIGIGDRWQGWDTIAWLKTEVNIPLEWQGRTIVGLFDFGKTGPGHTSGFESLLYVNGVPYQGVGGNHREVFLPSGAAGTTIQLLFKLWTGLNGHSGKRVELEHQIQTSEIALLQEVTDDFYYSSLAVYQTFMYLKEDRWERDALIKALDRAFAQIDWRHPGSVDFNESILRANTSLKHEMEAIPAGGNPVTIHAIGHSHLDVAWLWRLRHTREKAARTFSTVLRYMERYPEYVYLQTMPHLYEDLERDYPALFEQIQCRVASGQWEAGGAMWLEADCNIPTGESLTRQLLYGIRYFEEKFGLSCTYLWLPDVFGYSWALPQILHKAGIRAFMTTKINWSQYNRFPHDTFYWKGIDGTKLLTHYITTPNLQGYQYSYSGQIAARTLAVTWEQYQDKEINDKFLLAFGHGDGGGGPTRDMLEMRRRFEHMPGMPKVVTGRADRYFQELDKRVRETDRYVHTWDGELYLERHRGTFTSQAYVKTMNRRMEGLLHDAELVNSIKAALQGFKQYPFRELHESWIIVLRNQFHDILPGSSIAEVYEDCHIDYDRAEQLAQDALTRGISGIASQIMHSSGVHNGYLVFNTIQWERTEIIELPWHSSYSDAAWKDSQGNDLISQKSVRSGEEKLLLLVPHIPAFGYTTVSCCKMAATKTFAAAKPQPLIQVQSDGLNTPYYEIRWNEFGQLMRLYDKRMKREFIEPGEAANRFDLHEDKPLRNDAWDIDLFYYEKSETITGLKRIELIESGELRTVIRFEWKHGETVIEQDLIVYPHHRRIDFVTKVDWQERSQLLKVAFPLQIRAVEATYEIQYGHVKRPTHWNTSWDYARFETCAQKWIDLSERGAGISLLNDCKYGHEVRDNVMRLTLLKSSIAPDPLADQGLHTFTYSLLPHEGDWFAASTIIHAQRLNSPVHLAELPEVKELLNVQHGSLPDKTSFFRCRGDHVVVDTIKRAEDSDAWIVRCYEYAGKRGNVCFESLFPLEHVAEVNLLERENASQTFESQQFQAWFQPFEIKTFLITVRSGGGNS